MMRARCLMYVYSMYAIHDDNLLMFNRTWCDFEQFRKTLLFCGCCCCWKDSLTIVLSIGDLIFIENICSTSFSHYTEHRWWCGCHECWHSFCRRLLFLMVIEHAVAVTVSNCIAVIFIAIAIVVIVTVIIVIFNDLVGSTTRTRLKHNQHNQLVSI